jgi:hypothetical protein
MKVLGVTLVVLTLVGTILIMGGNNWGFIPTCCGLFVGKVLSKMESRL